MTLEAALNLASGACFVAAVACAILSRRERSALDQSGMALVCAVFAMASSTFFLAGAL